jgi:polyhydroxybutyrate depolymerase
MKKIYLIISLTILTMTSAFSQNVYDSIYVGNRWRTYMTHLPTGYNPSNQYPLVLCFHGGQNGAQSAQLGWQAVAYMSNLSQKADTAGFIVVYPEGKVINNNRTWNAGGCCQPATTNNIDDVGFVSHLIDTLINNYSVDSLRVYASGSSNGALLCYRLACELPNKIAAIASISGTQEYFPCNPTQKMPIINFHSKVDIAVPYNGGVGQGPSGTNFTSQDSTMQLWTALNNCATRDTVFNGGNTNYTFIRIHNCSCQVEYHHYATSDGGHSWPSGNPNNNPVSYQVNATNLLWSFFQNYTLGCLTTGLNNTGDLNIKTIVYPNPFTKNITLTNRKGNEEYTLINFCGQVIWTGKSIEQNDFSFLSSGLYFLKVDTMTIKLIKQ